jgi:hypothetical protein
MFQILLTLEEFTLDPKLLNINKISNKIYELQKLKHYESCDNEFFRKPIK